MVRRSLLMSLALAGALLAPTTHALAAPINAEDAQVLTATCSDGHTYTVVANSGNAGNQNNATTWGPGFIISGGTGHLIPTQFIFTGTDLQTGQVVFSQTQDKGNAQAAGHGTVLTCGPIDVGTFPLPNGDTGQGTITVTGTLVGH